ncbi:hypothetical protein BV898_00609 [Hypsibius exemplaris]|uniref:Maelstrom domain-containing protein n=1 Tax=Hypsibius exemplaris TaxID=2072580 RepID=A0A1W0XDY4_HYPEX|nr:hypothetical protein BV898_00609 [Hypsibius exemplaris]
MPPKKLPKPNAYSLYVQERCLQTGVPMKTGFTRFDGEWKAMYEAERSAFKDRATAIKTTVPRVSASQPQPCHKKRKRDALSAEHRKPKTLENLECGECESDSDSEELDGPMAALDDGQPFFKRLHIGEAQDITTGDGNHAFIEIGDQIAETSFGDDCELTTTSAEESLENLNHAYKSHADIMELTVFSFSCVPVIYAAGYKKGQTLALNRPLELAVTRFNLEEGIELDDFFHAYVDPAGLPAGASCDADAARDERHGLPHANEYALAPAFFDDGRQLEGDYLGLYRQLLDFVGYDGTNALLLMPLCSRKADLAVNELCMKWLHAQAVFRLNCVEISDDLPELKFAALEDFLALALARWMSVNERYTELLEKEALDAAFKHEQYRQLHILNCPYHRAVVSVKNCALGAARESYLTNHLRKPLGLPGDERFIFRGDSNMDETD